ncbi:sigma-70 family RNA polymerase sigma factor [Clostridium lundense]|uniref:sigma-70 family RNA polymerase sigma factor n=1 Tax=Clostridium lundense TaxID=319475 RepID=UPI0004881B9E|nr:sigma-70 family RNA polymerase sigma factor [Clostridium lundense]
MKSNGENYIQRLKEGKEDALDYIVDNYLPLVKGTVSKVLSPLRDDGLIEECVNDVFLSIWNNAMKFRGDVTDFKKWVYVVSKFKAIDCYRVNIKNIETVLDDIEITNENSAEDNFITMENKSEILKLIDSLKDIDRNIFVLKFFLGYKSEDIAKKLNITKASVDNRIYRGKRKLREKASNLEVI